MANLQSLLLPVSALGNQSSARLSTSRGALDAQGNRSEAPNTLDDRALSGEQSFSRLLNGSADSKPEESSRAKLLSRGLDAQGNRSETPDTLDDRSLSGEQSLSRLLNNPAYSNPEESSKAKFLSIGEANLSSSPVSDEEIAKLGPFSGKQLPVEGQVLPLSWGSGLDDLRPGDFRASAGQGDQSAMLQPSLMLPPDGELGSEGLIPITAKPIGLMANGQELSGEVNESALWSNFQRRVGDGDIVAPSISGVEVDIANASRMASKDSLSTLIGDTQAGIDQGLDRSSIPSAGMGDIDLSGKPLTDAQPLPLLNSSSEYGNGLPSLGDQTFIAPRISSMVLDSESNSLSLIQNESSLLVGDSGETELAFAGSQVLPEVQGSLASQESLEKIELSASDALLTESLEVQFKASQQQISDASVKESQLSNPSAAPVMTMNLSAGISSEEVTQGRSKGVDFLSSLDVSGSAEDSAAEFSKFEGLTPTQGPKSGDKALPFVAGNSLTSGAVPGDAPAVQNHSVTNGTSLTNALSQWRVDQDNASVTNADPLERQGFTKLSVPFNQSGWGESLGRQLSLLLAKNMDSAQIQLDPPELGPLTVKIQINQDQVSLQFTSGHSAVREALEQSSQRLQQMFSDEGLDLVDVDVSDQKSDSNQNDQQGEAKPKFGESSVDLADESDGLLTPVRNVAIDDGNIDYFI
jgi:flagellar hook-length control protein FliK